MKKILILSDTHGNGKALEKLSPLVAENDYVIHLGDGVGDMRVLRFLLSLSSVWGIRRGISQNFLLPRTSLRSKIRSFQFSERGEKAWRGYRALRAYPSRVDFRTRRNYVDQSRFFALPCRGGR